MLSGNMQIDTCRGNSRLLEAIRVQGELSSHQVVLRKRVQKARRRPLVALHHWLADDLYSCLPPLQATRKLNIRTNHNQSWKVNTF